MKDEDKSKEQLLYELIELREQKAYLIDKLQLSIKKINKLEIESEKYRNIFKNTIV